MSFCYYFSSIVETIFAIIEESNPKALINNPTKSSEFVLSNIIAKYTKITKLIIYKNKDKTFPVFIFKLKL